MIFVFSYPEGYSDRLVAKFWGLGAEQRCEEMIIVITKDIEKRGRDLQQQLPNSIPEKVKTKGKFVCDSNLSKYHF